MTEENLFEEIDQFFDNPYQDYVTDTVNEPTSNTLIKSTASTPLDMFYSKLEAMGFNLDELKDILECSDSMLILSAAGSGKTTALILKIIRDLLAGDVMKIVDTPHGRVMLPAKILVSTFLKTGAEDLKASFMSWCKKLGITGIDSSTITFKTLHAEVFDAIKQMGVKVDILENTDSLLRTVMQAYNIRSVLATSRNVTADEVSDISCILTYARNRLDMKRYEHSLMDDYSLNTLMLDAILLDFKKRRNASGKMDFEDMQEMLLEGLRTNEAVREFIAKRYDYIYVDEYQDTAQLQYEILKYYYAGCNKVICIGDDDQCLVEGTLVSTANGLIPIEQVRFGDLVQSGVGRSGTGFYPVDNISKKHVSKEIVVIKTRSGKEIRGTKEHIGFAKLVPNPDVFYVYLMYRADIGFRIGQTRGVRAGAKGILRNGISQRLNQENGDKAWLIRKADTLEEATFWESYYAYKYAIPQYVFNDPMGKARIALSFDTIVKLHQDLGTEENGYHLLYDLGLNKDYPHAVPQAAKTRCTLNYSMFSSVQVSKQGVHKSELSASTSSDNYVEVLKRHLPVTIKQATSSGSDYYNARNTTTHIDSQMSTIKEIQHACKDNRLQLEIVRDAKFTEEKFNFMPLGNFIEGMIVPIVDDNGQVIEDEVVSVTKEMYEGYVYDVSIPATRNFVANGILVHNCIYSWRGSDIDIILDTFRQDYNPTVKQLTMNYRCAKNILEAVTPSIKKNSKRHDKELRSQQPIGQLTIVSDSDVNHLLTSIKDDLSKQGTVGVIARTNADLLVPAILLELDGGVEFSVSKSVNLNSRIPRQVFGLMDLVTKRFTEEFEGHFKLFLTKYYYYEAEKLSSVLRVNKDKNIYNIPMKDLEYSVPRLAPILRGLREAVKQDKVLGYLFLLDALTKYVYTGKSIYAQKAVDFTRLVKKLIVEHNSLKDMEIGDLDRLFNTILPERLTRRVKYGNNNFIKLTTVHEAKGKEWDSVYIWNDIEGCFPNSVGNRELTLDEIEEERRVHYIAWTRAKRKLTVYTITEKMGTFLKECDLANANITQDVVEQDTTRVVYRKRITVAEELDVEKLARDYIVEATSSGNLMDEKVANAEMVLQRYDMDTLVDKLKQEYNIEGYPADALQEVLPDIFEDLVNKLFNTGDFAITR